MAINYSLSVGSVKKRLVEGEFNDVVIEASFGVSASSDAVTETDAEGNEVVVTPSFSYSCGGTKQFSVSEIDPATFIPFEQITKETIVQWLLAEEGITSVEEFSYVKSSIQNIAQRIYEYSQEVPASVPGEDPSGSSTVEYVPPTPAPEVPASEETVDAPAEPLA